MRGVLVSLLLLGGTIFMFITAVGLMRLPDLYTRMHAVTKAGTLGIGLVLIAAAVAFGEAAVTARAIAAVLFVLLTAPVSAHMIGRAGYLGQVPLWERTGFDHWNADYEELRREGEAPPSEANAPTRSETGSTEASG